MAERNKLLRKAVSNTYKILTSIQKHSKNASNDLKTPKKGHKTVKFVNTTNKDNTDARKTLKGKTVKSNNKTKHHNWYNRWNWTKWFRWKYRYRWKWKGLCGLEEPPLYGNDIRQQWHNWHWSDGMTRQVLWTKPYYIKFRVCKTKIVKFGHQNSQNWTNIRSIRHRSYMFMYFTKKFEKITNKINLIRKPLKVNSASGATLGPIGIAPLDLNIKDQTFTHNFIAWTRLKQHLLLGLNFALRYKIEID